MFSLTLLIIDVLVHLNNVLVLFFWHNVGLSLVLSKKHIPLPLLSGQQLTMLIAALINMGFCILSCGYHYLKILWCQQDITLKSVHLCGRQMFPSSLATIWVTKLPYGPAPEQAVLSVLRTAVGSTGLVRDWDKDQTAHRQRHSEVAYVHSQMLSAQQRFTQRPVRHSGLRTIRSCHRKYKDLSLCSQSWTDTLNTET